MIRCPIINKDIDIGECVMIFDILDRRIKETLLPKEVEKVKEWKEICKSCKFHNM